MATVAVKQAAQLRNLILRALKDRAYRPIELLHGLQSAEVTESALKDALAELINAGLIELSPDRHIRLREPISAAR
jgi:DNA-binding HxlR family transcriptional regulator